MAGAGPIGKGRPTRAVKLVNAAVSTSGDLFQFVEVGGNGIRTSSIPGPDSG